MPRNQTSAGLGQSLLVRSKSSYPLREPEVTISVFGHAISIIATTVVLAVAYVQSSTSSVLWTVWCCMLVTVVPSLSVVAAELFGRSLPVRTHKVIVACSNATLDVICVAVAFVSGMAFQAGYTDILSSYACVWTFVYATICLLAVFSRAYDAAADSSPKMRFSPADEVRTLPSDENEVLDENDNA